MFAIKSQVSFLLMALFLSGCFPQANPFPPQGKTAKQATDEMIEKFSQARLRYALSAQDTPDNREILKEVVWQQGYFLPEVLMVLERENPTLMKNVFSTASDGGDR